MEGSEVVKREPGSPLSPAETNLLGTSIHEPITWIYHDIEDDEEMLSSGRFGLDSGRKNPAIRYRQPRPLRKMEAFHSQKLWQYAADIWECIDYLLAPARRDFSNREHPERWEAQWQKTRNLLGDRTVTWIEVVGTPDNGPCACCIKSGSVCALPLASDGIYQVHVTCIRCVIRRKTCDLNIAKPNNKSRKRPGDTNDTPAEDSPAVRRPRQKGAIEVIVPTRRHSLTGTGAIRTGSTAEAAELAGRAEEVMLLKQPHLHAVWQALEKGCMNKTPPYEQRGAKMLDMMLDTHNHWGVLRSYKGSKERRCICRKKLGQDCIVQIMRSSTASGALQAGERVTITKCLKCQAAGLDACDVDGARILTVPENDPRDASKGAVRNRRRITIGASVTDGQAAPSHPSADAPAASVPDIDREQMSAPITSHVSRSTTPAGPPQVTTLATPPMSAAAAPVNSNAALLPIPALIPVRNAAEAEERRQSLDRFLQYAANMFGHDKNRPADGNPIVDVNLAWDIGDALRRMKKLEDDPTNVDLMKETQTWTETAVDSVERHVVKLSRERGQRDLRTVSRYKDAQADLAAWKLASGM